MKPNKHFLAFTMTTLLSLSLLSGCGATTNSGQSATSGSNPLDFSNTTLNGTVTATDDNVITLSLSDGMGGRQMMNGGMNKGKDSSDRSSENSDNEQTAPDMPEGNDNGQTPPDMPEGNDNGQTLPDWSAGSTSFTLTITDESVLKDTSLSDITEGSMLTITFGDNNTITSITVTDTSNMSPDGAAQQGSPDANSNVDTGTD